MAAEQRLEAIRTLRLPAFQRQDDHAVTGRIANDVLRIVTVFHALEFAQEHPPVERDSTVGRTQRFTRAIGDSALRHPRHDVLAVNRVQHEVAVGRKDRRLVLVHAIEQMRRRRRAFRQHERAEP